MVSMNAPHYAGDYCGGEEAPPAGRWGYTLREGRLVLLVKEKA